MSPLDFLRSPALRRHWVRVKNGQSTTIPPHSVVLITSSTVTNGSVVHTVRQPNAASTDFNWNGYLITGPFEIGASTNYEGVATTATEGALARYDTGTPAMKEVWGPKHGQFTLSKGYHGFEIIGSTTTSPSGTNVVPVRWIGVDSVLGKTDASVTSGSTCTVSVWSGTTAGSESDTTMNVASCYLRYGYVPTTCFVHVKLDNGIPYIAGDHRTVVVKADAAIAKGASGTCSIYSNEVDTTDNITAKALGAAIVISKWATAWHEEKSGTWFVAPWECS